MNPVMPDRPAKVNPARAAHFGIFAFDSPASASMILP